MNPTIEFYEMFYLDEPFNSQLQDEGEKAKQTIMQSNGLEGEWQKDHNENTNVMLELEQFCQMFEGNDDDLLNIRYISYFVNTNYTAGLVYSEPEKLLAKFYPTLMSLRICKNDFSMNLT